jgi:hypothetical protein
MEIKPTYVTFEQAKLLKEKGFDEPCNAYFNFKIKIELFAYNHFDQSRNSDMYPYTYGEYTAPEQWQVVEWLRVNHGIWIYIDMTGSEKFYPRYRYIDKNGQHYVGDFKDDNNERFLKDTPQKAYSAAFDYIFNNLI